MNIEYGILQNMMNEFCLCYKNNTAPQDLRSQATNRLKDLLMAQKEQNGGTVPPAIYSYTIGCDAGNCTRSLTATLTLEEATSSVPKLSAEDESLFRWEGSCTLVLPSQIETLSV